MFTRTCIGENNSSSMLWCKAHHDRWVSGRPAPVTNTRPSHCRRRRQGVSDQSSRRWSQAIDQRLPTNSSEAPSESSAEVASAVSQTFQSAAVGARRELAVWDEMPDSSDECRRDACDTAQRGGAATKRKRQLPRNTRKGVLLFITVVFNLDFGAGIWWSRNSTLSNCGYAG